MVELIKEFDELSWVKKLLVAIIAPLAWNLYRLAKSIEKKSVGGIILAAIFALPLSIPVSIFDIVFIMIKKNVWWID